MRNFKFTFKLSNRHKKSSFLFKIIVKGVFSGISKHFFLQLICTLRNHSKNYRDILTLRVKSEASKRIDEVEKTTANLF